MGRDVKVLVLLEPDPELPPPPLDLLPADVDVVQVGPTPSDEELAGATVLYVWDHRFADLGPILRRTTQLQWVHAASIGVNRLMCPELSAVTLTNSRGVFDTSISEWVLAAVLAHVKDLRETWRLQTETTWTYRTTGRLAGTRAAVVGTGSIGRAIADRLSRLDVRVTLVGRRPGEDPTFGTVHGSDDLVSIAAAVDLLVLAVPLTPGTTALVDAEVLGALGPRGLVVNVGRGPTIVESDLVDALRNGTIAAAALDVFDVEPLPADSPLWAMPNVLVSPHMSGDYRGFEVDMMDVFTDNLERWRRGNSLRNVVDPAAGYVPQ
ncbi:2-hydroxyacid dehydrogenase [Mycolicibacterium madagascariense]|uniref:2-hydroxyacid dehydrogenase n=1 Tax=Mycolicibacterium madagascariense TaxID=212765 RepID=A0A7I7XI16_9MYCO|nr:D-2-hydroxyacid dehydrogenase [Mycolicibacterium madagascariense]MCV7015796.1 D-2-hydroxyacid dehydrogenase [Mycolicibacterium madagascariense]BBZ28839.1 2-hydroxyacid dehydrogenase [Mycolicibacterium madagascariense]